MTKTTAALVLNEKLHLSTDGTVQKCAGRRYGRPVVSIETEIEDLPPVGPERAGRMATVRRETREKLAAELTEAQRANLCEKCCDRL